MRRPSLAGPTIALAILAGAPLAAQTITQITQNGSSLQDQYPVMSADATTIAWIGNDPVSRAFEVFAATAPSYTAQQLTTGSGISIPYQLSLSGDGKIAIYIAQSQVWAVPTAGGTPKQVTTYTSPKAPRGHNGITASHDGRYACYTTYDSQSRIYDVEVVDTASQSVSNVTKLTTSDNCYGAISGDGQTVVVADRISASTPELWRTDRTSSTFLGLTTLGASGVFWPRVDHFGRMAASEFSIGSTLDVFSVRTDGSGSTNVSTSATQDRRVMLAGDGDRLTWKSARVGQGDIFMAYPEGGGVRQITTFGDMSPSLTNCSHALNGDGTVAAIATRVNVQGQNPEGDWELWLFRDAITQAGTATPGGTVVFNLNAPAHPNEVYLVRSAFSRSPGIPIPGGTVPLTPDSLFFLSGAVPQIFQNYGGVLDAQGRGAASVAIPNLPLQGFAFYTSFVAVGTGGITAMNPVKTLIQ